jgi:alpha/beta superfamily hydrolase
VTGDVEPLALTSVTFRLDARVHVPAGTPIGSVAVGHPHPAHGGNMDHSVVVALAERAAAAGLVAVRFDLRGVRESEGDVRDAAGHVFDLMAASSAAERRAPGLPRFGAGFSYGARLWASASAQALLLVDGLLLLAPATRVLRSSRDFGDLLLGRPVRHAAVDSAALATLASVPVPSRILVGSLDVVAPPDELAAHASRHATVKVLDGLNHFFARGTGPGATALDVLVPAVDEAIRALLSR